MRTPPQLWLLACLLTLTGPVAAAGPEFVVQSRPVRPDPFAESLLQINPPTFRWPAEVEPGATWRVEIARDPQFSDPQVAVVSTLFHRPLQPLESGTWHWRVRRETPEPGPWLGPESFTVSADLPCWPLAPWSEWMARIPATYPRTFISREELLDLRANARRLGPALEPWIASAKEHLSAPFSLEEWQARVPPGADPFGPDSPERKQLVWASKGAARAAAEPMGEGAWLWLATGDEWYVEPVRARARLVASLDPAGFISERNTGHDLGNVDFGNSTIVHHLGLVYDLMYDRLTPGERAQIRAAILARAAPIFAKVHRVPIEMMRAHAWQHGFVDAMVGAIAICADEPRAREWVELGLKSFVAMYPWFGGRDGGSQEGPRYYHGAGMIPSLNVLDLFRNAFGLRLEEGNPWFRANPYFLVYSYPPNGLQTQLGDSNPGHFDEGDDRRTPGGKARIAALRMAELHGNGHLAAYAAALPEQPAPGYTVAEFLRWSRPPAVTPVPLWTLPPARAFRDVGVVIAHSRLADPEESVRFVFHASPYGGQGHAHADQNSFHVIAYNEHLLLDSGWFTPTGDPHREEWYVRTMAHNTLLVDGTGQQWGGTSGHARLGVFEQNDEWVYFTGHAATAYRERPLERFDRHVVWLRGGEVETYVVADDVVAAGGVPRRFDWLLHAANRMTADDARRIVEVTGERGEARVTFVQPDRLEFHQDDQFTVPATYWRRGRNFPLPNQWHLKATPPPSPQARFLAVIQVSKRGVSKPPVRAVDGGVETAGFRVRWPEGGDRLLIRKLP